MKKGMGGMNRRELLQRSAALGLAAAIPTALIGCASDRSAVVQANHADEKKTVVVANPLKPPAEGHIPVAFLISEGVDPIDVFGPWEIFHQAVVPASFHLYSVGETRNPINVMMGGMVRPF